MKTTLFFGWACVLALGCGDASTSETGNALPDYTGGSRSVVAEPSGRTLTLTTAKPTVVLGKNEFVIAPFDGTVKAATGFMPAHGHGTKPTVVEVLPDGSSKVPLVLYMSGRWEVSFDIERAGAPETVRVDVQVP
jgi:hypothetical protein